MAFVAETGQYHVTGKTSGKILRGFKAVNGADLNVEKGSIVAVIGPNGAGKTTLFNLVAGHLRPNSGQVLFKGKEIGGLPP